MLLSELLKDIPCTNHYSNKTIHGLSHDSRSIKPGWLFLAYRGMHADGHEFIREAIINGAVAVLAEPFSTKDDEYRIPVIIIPRLTEHLGIIASRFYEKPSEHLKLIGVTGTNGKTTCVHFISTALQKLNQVCGVIGTLGKGIVGDLKEATLTTPDAIEFHALLAEFLKQEAGYATVEVSSHRLAQQRLKGTHFNLSIFTNLTQDHLDFHGSLAQYALAKRSFFELPNIENILLNADDMYGKIWLNEFSAHPDLYAYSLSPPDPNRIAIPHIYANSIHLTEEGICAQIISPWGEASFKNSFLLGRFNLSNILVAVGALGILGFPLKSIIKVLSTIRGARGRMEALGGQKNVPLVVVDYAHTPDALQQTLQALRAHTKGQLICVFGCGGNRDKGKRPLMGAIAEKHADMVILTNDNPRDESPNIIVKDILEGMLQPARVRIEYNRRAAIALAIELAGPQDKILIAGKGHENYQLISGKKWPMNDVETVKKYLAR